MVRLTADLILRSPQYFNAVRERELDLRGNKIAVIENLGATEDHFDSVDISDNEIVKLEGFPLLKRLTTLIANNNRIARINVSIGDALPNLTTLVLTSNRLVNLGELDPLASAKKLQLLSLLDNLVTKKPNYRLYVIHKLPKLKVLDFKKVKQKEREDAKKLFASKEKEVEVRKASVKTFVPGEVAAAEAEADEAAKVVEAEARKGPTPEQILAIKSAIASAQTLEEVARLEKALKSGQMPSEMEEDEKEEEEEEEEEEEAEPAPPKEAPSNGGGATNGAAAMEEG